jgi:hypothetical protein
MVRWDEALRDGEAAVLVAAGLEFLATAVGLVPVPATAVGGGLPTVLSASFGVVTLALGFGVATAVAGVRAFAPIFVVYSATFCWLAGALAPFQCAAAAATLAASAAAALLALTSLRVSRRAATTATDVPPSALRMPKQGVGAEVAPVEEAAVEAVAAAEAVDYYIGERRGRRLEFSGLSWTVEMAMAALALAFALSAALAAALWAAARAALRGVGAGWLLPWLPPGMAALPLAGWWVRFVARGAPFVTSDPARLSEIGAIAAAARRGGKRPARAADLGSGDGRLLLELAHPQALPPPRPPAQRLQGKIHRVDPDFGSTLTASNRDSQ